MKDIHQRGVFLESLIKTSPDLGAVFLNHSGSPERLLTDIQSIDLFAEKKVFENVLAYVKMYPLVRKIRQVHFFRMRELWIEFEDHTEIRLRLIRSFIRKGMVCLDPRMVRESAHTNEHGMLVPSEGIHFEYLILASQFNKVHLPDRYRNHFSGFERDQKSAVFGYINERLSLVIHGLSDLYDYSPAMLFKIVLSLRKRKANSLFRISLRLLELSFFKALKPVLFRNKTIDPESISKAIEKSSGEGSGQAAETAVL